MHDVTIRGCDSRIYSRSLETYVQFILKRIFLFVIDSGFQNDFGRIAFYELSYGDLIG